jgi:hypothetical protein
VSNPRREAAGTRGERLRLESREKRAQNIEAMPRRAQLRPQPIQRKNTKKISSSIHKGEKKRRIASWLANGDMTHQTLTVDLDPTRRGFENILLNPVFRGHERTVPTVCVERDDLMDTIDQHLAYKTGQRRIARTSIARRQLSARPDSQSNLGVGL